MNADELTAARALVAHLEDPLRHNAFCEQCILFKLYKPILAHVDEQDKQIAALKAALIEKQYRLMPTAPSCYNDARRRAAIEELVREMPVIFGEDMQ